MKTFPYEIKVASVRLWYVKTSGAAALLERTCAKSFILLCSLSQQLQLHNALHRQKVTKS